jgi:hypothetical protein
MGIRRKDGVEDVLNPTVAHDERQTLDQCMPGNDVSRKGESVRQLKISITQKRKGQTQPLDHFKLVLCRLRREPGHGRARIPRSAAWSRKAQDSGVQPRAPGMRSQSGVSGGSPGRPVRG